jgi:acetyl-CoA carboxylase carboxyltransferase component
MHAAVSGTIDFREPDDAACLERLRRLVAALPPDPAKVDTRSADGDPRLEELAAATGEYEVRDLLARVLDEGAPFDEYKKEYGQTLVCGFGRLGGVSVGVVANERRRVKSADGPVQFGGVIYVDSADKAARFVMDCNQLRVPILFVQNVNGSTPSPTASCRS